MRDGVHCYVRHITYDLAPIYPVVIGIGLEGMTRQEKKH